MLTDMLHVSVSKHKIDEEFTLVWANPYYYEIIGYEKDEYERLFRNSPVRFFERNPEDLAVITKHVKDALEHGRDGYACTTRMYHKSGRLRWIKINATFLDERVDGSRLSYTVMTDVTDLVEARQRMEEQRRELQEANERLERLAFVDPVTDGLNQTRFDLEAAAAIAAAPPDSYKLVSLDIVRFKLINDLNGKEAGNRVLSYVHDCLRASLREGELVARISADTFNLLIRAEAPDAVEERVEAMVKRINGFNEGVEHPDFLSFSVGVYRIDEPELPMTILRDRANVARNIGRRAESVRHFTCDFYSDEDRQALLRRRKMGNRMHKALENGEFAVYLQPKQRLSDGRIAGAEALVRWMDPEEGFVPPDEFIPFFESNGFVIDLDLHVFDQVCSMIARWLAEGREPVPVSVNMSRMHLLSGGFLEAYDEVRERHGVPAELVVIELTETIAFENPEAFEDVIDELHAHGYRCSLDDFGSGYSSLNALKDLRIDELKLDRAFFSNGDAADTRDWDVVSSIVDLAKRLELETVAEGIETFGQVERLRVTGCDLLQGYVLSRPVPVEEFERLAFGE